MKLVRHIVMKDLGRFWPGIIVLSGLVASKLFLADTVFYHDSPGDWGTRIQQYQLMLLALHLAVTFYLAVSIVQEDSVPEASAYWQTLPLTRGQLLAAKLLGLVLICVLPVVLTLALGWMMLGLPASQLGWPLALLAGIQLGLAWWALAFGSLTKNVGHLFALLMAVALALLVPALIFAPLLQTGKLIPPGVWLTHTLLIYGVGFAGCLAVMLNQYFGRSQWRSIAFIGVGVLLCLYLLGTEHTSLSLDWASRHLAAQRDLDARIARLGVTLDQVELVRPKPDADEPLAQVQLRVSVEEPDQGLAITPYNFYFQWPDTKNFLPLQHLPSREPRGRDLRRIAEDELGLSPGRAASPLVFGAETRLSLARQPWPLSQAATYQGQIDLAVYRTTVEGELPLTKGATLHSTAGTTTLLGIDSDGSFVHVNLEGRYSGMGVDPGWLPDPTALGRPVSRWNGVLVNRKTKTLLTSSRFYSAGLSSYAYGADLARVWLAFSLPKTEAGAANLADWNFVVLSQGAEHRSIKYFQTGLSYQEVPAITPNPAWQQ
jgi:hypothetical protein